MLRGKFSLFILCVFFSFYKIPKYNIKHGFYTVYRLYSARYGEFAYNWTGQDSKQLCNSTKHRGKVFLY